MIRHPEEPIILMVSAIYAAVAALDPVSVAAVFLVSQLVKALTLNATFSARIELDVQIRARQSQT